jgi:hypothetical protein
MNAPFAYQGALTNAFMFHQYAPALANARLGQFFWIVQAPVYAGFPDEDMPADMKARRDELAKTSLFASYDGKSFNPSPTTRFYRRDTGEAVAIEELDALGLRLPSFADRIGNYFGRFEFKSEPSDGVGLLERRKIVVAAKQYIGKSSSPLADVDDGIDEETFIQFGTSAASELTAFNGKLLDGLDLHELAHVLRVLRPDPLFQPVREGRFRDSALGALTEPYETRLLIEALDVTEGADGKPSVVVNRKKIEDDLTERLRRFNRAQLVHVRGLIGAKHDQWVDELGAVVKGDKPLHWLCPSWKKLERLSTAIEEAAGRASQIRELRQAQEEKSAKEREKDSERKRKGRAGERIKKELSERLWSPEQPETELTFKQPREEIEMLLDGRIAPSGGAHRPLRFPMQKALDWAKWAAVDPESNLVQAIAETRPDFAAALARLPKDLRTAVPSKPGDPQKTPDWALPHPAEDIAPTIARLVEEHLAEVEKARQLAAKRNDERREQKRQQKQRERSAYLAKGLCPAGQHRGKRWAEVPTEYLSWMLNADFEDDVKEAVKAELTRRSER